MGINSVYGETSWYAFFKSVFVPLLRPAFLKSVPSIFNNFFFRQYRAALLPGRIPVSSVDHPLDKEIPFAPSWVTIYIDFVNFWIRMLSYLLRRYGRRVHIHVRDFILSVGKLYAYAATVYKKNMSTTERPFYIARPRFFMIHLLDPHLMCIPSLHVMVAAHTYTKFADIVKKMGDEETLKEQVLEMKHGALAITQAILFVKQHSINCIPAALYAMTRFSPQLFPSEAAAAFTGQLFSTTFTTTELKNCPVHPSAAPSTKLSAAVQAKIKEHILFLYERFMKEGERAAAWEEPLMNFLKEARNDK